MKFDELNLRPSLAQTLKNLNFENCTPIQDAVIPVIAEGKDVFGLAQTGTGKTAAFLLPMMDRILCGQESAENPSDEERARTEKRAFQKWQKTEFVLVLTPTRELAEQIFQDVERFGSPSGLKAVAIYGGSSYEQQKALLAKGVEFVVGTPGRLIDLYKSHALDLKQVRAVIFDEADRMFDMGFKDDMKYLLQRIPRERQMLMFSATLNFDVLTTAYQFGSEPVEIDVSRDQAKAENVKDSIYHVGTDEKARFLLSVFKKQNPRQTIIFSNFKHNVERIARFLTENGYPAMGISSLLTQAQRNKVIEQFKAENDRNILVATDVAARGLDIKGVDMIVNFDLPEDAENYVHRIGRTGRAGQEGKAFSFVSDRDVDALTRIEDYLKHKVIVEWMDETDLVADFKPFRADEGRYGRPAFSSSRSASEFRKGPGGGSPRGGSRRGPERGEGRFDGGQRRRSGPDESRGPRSAGVGGEGRDARGGPRHEDRPRRPSAAGAALAAPQGRGEARDSRHRSATGSPHSAGKSHGQQGNGKFSGSHAAKAGGPNSQSQTRRAQRPGDKNRQRSRPADGKRASGKAASAVSQKGVASKVSGFFKRLFGG